MSMDHGLTFFGISNIFCNAVFLWRHQIKIHDVIVGKIYFFLQRSCYIPLESPFYADLESSKNHGLKVKSWIDILIWIWACDVTWLNWNRNISPGLHFQSIVLMWFLISVVLAFQWRKKYFRLLWRHVIRSDDVTEKRPDRIFSF